MSLRGNISDMSKINEMHNGCYSISAATTNKPTGMLDVGILLALERGDNRAGIAITWNSTNTIRLHVLVGGKYAQVFSG